MGQRAFAAERMYRGALIVIVLAFAIAASLLFARAANAWYTTKYEDSAVHAAQSVASTCCQASREWNKIWRPTPIYFCSHYPPDVMSYACSLWNNPIVDERNAFNSWAHCYNNDSVSSYPTTCQTTHP